ncbi:MAG TPA: hypothetical protein VJ697_08830 [Nitrososphaeraceae archaeon]|nr:hypothetical protein [Nitrososphaeraceae archaeon]
MSNYNIEKMDEYRLDTTKLTSTINCEVCGLKQRQIVESETTITKIRSINEFCRDGIIKVHFSCSNHIVELFNQITKEIENKSKLLHKKF